MFLFIVFCILAVIAAIVFAASFVAPKEAEAYGGGKSYPRRYVRLGGTATLVVALAFLFFASFTTVGSKNIAVLTEFGKPVGFLNNGFHWKAPWRSPKELNDAVQTDTYASDGGVSGKQQGGAAGACINVRIARQATACVNVSIRWQIRAAGIQYLYRNYQSTSAIQDNVVLRDLQQAMNEAFTDYDPLGIDSNGNSTNVPLSSAKPGQVNLSNTVQTQMESEIGKYIDVQSVIIPLLNFDTQTQDRINQLQQQVALTRVAVQAKLTAQAQAQANKALSSSVATDPNVLVSKCLDILQDAINKGLALPAGFSCFGGSSSTAIAVPAK